MTILIVDDNLELLSACSRALRRICSVRTAKALPEAIASFDAHRDWRAVIIDVNLGEGFERGGLDFLAHVRRRRPRLAVAMLSADDSRATVNASAQLGAVYFVKPLDIPALQNFVKRSSLTLSVTPEDVAVLVRDVSVRLQLTPREEDVLESAVARIPRETFLQTKGISRSTWDKHVGRILQKSGADTLEQFTADLLEKAMRSR